MRFTASSLSLLLLFYTPGTTNSSPYALLFPQESSRVLNRKEDHRRHEEDLSRPRNAITTHQHDHSDLPVLRQGQRRQRHLYGNSLKKGYWRNLMAQEERMVEIDPMGNRVLQSSSSSSSTISANIALMICQASIAIEEQTGKEFGTHCTCTLNESSSDPTPTATLDCQDTHCAYCNSDATVCTGYSYGVTYDNEGNEIEFFEQDAYTLGKSGVIRYTESDGECTMVISGTICSTCALQDCNDGYYGIDVACNNIELGTSYNSCQTKVMATGILQAYDDDVFGTCYNTSQLCAMDINNLEQLDRLDCQCDGNATSFCQGSCEYCDPLLQVCGQESLVKKRLGALVVESTRAIQYTTSRSENLTYVQSNCNAMGCQACSVKVNNVECNSCTMHMCGDGTYAPRINCQNMDPTIGQTIDFCQPPSLAGHVLQYLQSNFTTTCATQAQIACRDAMMEHEDNQYSCSCIDATNGSSSSSLELQCHSTCGDFCKDDGSLCIRKSYHEEFLVNGTSSLFQKDIQYTIGRNETLSYIEYTDNTCSLTVDGVACQSCRVQQCATDSNAVNVVDQAPLLDCTNVEAGAVLDLCDPNQVMDTGILQALAMEANINQCSDRTPTNGACPSALSIQSFPITVNGSTILLVGTNESAEIVCGTVSSSSPGLWYSIVGTGVGMEASMCESPADFAPLLSLYSGENCNSITCLKSSDNRCKVRWLAEQGVNYFMRVHGVGDQVGNFGLAMTEFNWGQIECRNRKRSREQDTEIAMSCMCSDLNSDGYVDLNCSVDCVTCDASGSVCANRSESSTLDKGGRIVETQQNYQFTMGRFEYLTIQKSSCVSADDCETCQVLIDDKTCSNCTIIQCTFGSTGITATCGNDTINTCESGLVDSTNILHPLVESNYDQCFYREPLVACKEQLDYEQNLEGGIVCACHPVTENGDVRLECQRQLCLRCNQEKTICGFDTYGAVFDGVLGRLTDRFEGFQYVLGGSDFLSYQSVYNESTANDGCLLKINYQTCDRCTVAQCISKSQGQGQFHGMGFDCQNLPGGVFYDGCSSMDLPGSFAFINSPAFETCVDVVSPLDACEEALSQRMSTAVNTPTNCSCNATDAGGYKLICNQDCVSCDSAGAICATHSDQIIEINTFGFTAAQIDTYQYFTGRTETLVIRNYDMDCEVTINGQACDSCLPTDCDQGGERGYVVDCSRPLGEKATFECGQGHEIFTAIMKSVQFKCGNDATGIPIGSPNLAPIRDTRPSLSLHTSPSSGHQQLTVSSISTFLLSCVTLINFVG